MLVLDVRPIKDNTGDWEVVMRLYAQHEEDNIVDKILFTGTLAECREFLEKKVLTALDDLGIGRICTCGGVAIETTADGMWVCDKHAISGRIK